MSLNSILIDFVLPVFTAVIACLGTAYRNKQKKEKDILDNVQQIMDIQNGTIAKQESTLKRVRKLLDHLEIKYDRKSASVRKAYGCKVPSEECPVLISDAKLNKMEGDCYAYDSREEKEEKEEA